MTEVLTKFDEVEAEGVAEDRARYLYLRGRLLNVSGDFSSAAEACLSRSVKLNPNLVDAWNELGESYMRKHDWTTARTCFEVRLAVEMSVILKYNINVRVLFNMKRTKCH